MPPRPYTHDALDRVRSEQEAVEAKLDAIDRFIARVEDCPATPASPGPVSATAGVGSVPQAGNATEDGCQVVRRAFAETIRPHSLDDVEAAESLHETIGVELSEAIATALAPATDTTFSPTLKQAVLSEARSRRAETEAMRRALDRERDRVDAACDTVESIAGWIATADETPLTALGFEGLQQRHDQLAKRRDRCQRLAEQRQSFLDGRTTNGPEAGVSHRPLLTYIYQDFPVDHPVLATVASLDDTCAECQRAVRRHMVRQV
ncbi:DUF7260 family protein [Haloarchaeobius amylolyticus]|uniref:DUF7260 family protein n=1 Tax=Haloarchaeobius amylolyticus TaxID=1198296 RepID=UPI0022715412|nr:hypothetical protein [Haloarchaeobius amylolyticus]